MDQASNNWPVQPMDFDDSTLSPPTTAMPPPPRPLFHPAPSPKAISNRETHLGTQT